MRLVHRAAALFLIALIAPVLSCIAFVKPLPIGDHCAIHGSGACGDCVRNKCQAPIDACCMSSACTGASILEDLDACAGGELTHCANTLASKRTTATEDDVRACVAAQCTSECTQGVPPDVVAQPTWTCQTPRQPANACAMCIYDSCTKALDDCCADSSCQRNTSLQAVVGTCVAGDGPGCAYPRQQSESGLDGVVRACIRRSCASSCLAAFPHQSCAPQNGGDYCSCTDAEASRGPACSVAAVGGDCVVGQKGCTCGVYSCTEKTAGSSTTDCSCAFDGGGGRQTCTAPTNGTCCLKIESYADDVTCACSAYTTSCLNSIGEYAISSCSLADLRAALGGSGRFVSSCSQ